MSLKTFVTAFIITPLCAGQLLECPERNVSCDDIKTSGGFLFKHGGPKDSEVYIFANETLTAFGVLSSRTFNYTSEVTRFDNNSVITTRCQDLTVKCIILNGQKVTETCKVFKTTETKNPPPIDSSKLLALIFKILGVILVFVVCFGILCWCYMSWKKELRTQHGAAAASGFSQYLLTCYRLRKGTFHQQSKESEETRHEETEEDTAVDEDTQENGDIGTVNPRDGDPHGSGENETEQENALHSVHVHSIDSKVDGKTPQSLSLDHNFRNETIQPTKNGDISSPNVNRESHQRAMNKNTRDDPGGENSNKKKDNIRKMDSGWAVGDHDAEDHEIEVRPLLSNQRAAIQGFDMTGEAKALVNKHGFDQDQVSRCSVAPVSRRISICFLFFIFQLNAPIVLFLLD
ncbi:uncharacterized protein LOC103364149 [Stegastes partitus]|uniref:Uncharacterized protein LOC103364149 n=1 Tax=Stegastes partitus TaxID=144197 RepID=A0A9Y4KCG8_9TELE|nr:PREDICTED: uncharacterized protein LOC103364149 [Stegastes partitus]